MEVCLL